MFILLFSQHVLSVLKMYNTNKVTSSEFIIRHKHKAAVKINIFEKFNIKLAWLFLKLSPDVIVELK